MIRYLLLLLLAGSTLFSHAQKSAKRELRGAWISTHLGLDWPVGSQTPAQQRAALVAYLNEQKQYGINAIYFQIRSQSDALYPSKIEPWAYVLNGNSLTGTQDVDPGWDPLQFALDETHKRGMEFHAWMNPYRAVATASQLSNPKLFTARHVAKRKPEWLITAGTVITVDPAIPAVRDYIIDVIEEVLNNYDIDGLHFDDYFYAPGMTLAIDQNSYNTYATAEEKILYPNNTTGRANWRRENVNRFISQVHQTVSTLKPWVKFGVSPTGIYRNGVVNGGSATAGSEHYSSVFADSKKWLQEGWVDYIAPQLYWHIGFGIADYAVLVPWWNNNAFGKHIYIGMASYKVNMTFPTTGNGPVEQAAWKIPTQYPNELRLNRDAAYQNVLGELHFRVAFLRANALGHRDSMRYNIYKKPALLPTMSWLDNTPPASVTDLTIVKYGNDSMVLDWEKPAAADEMSRARQFVIYRSVTPMMDVSDTAYLLAVTNQDETHFADKSIAPNTTYYYSVTALDRLHNESTPTAVMSYQAPVVHCPTGQQRFLDSNCTAMVPDYRSLATVTASSPVTLQQVPAAGTVVTGTGMLTVMLAATDKAGNSDTCAFKVPMRDTIAPVITGLTADPSTLFPPNHKMRNVTLKYNVSDGCSAVNTTVTVTSNEADNATGDGNTEQDWEVINNHKLKLRAERSGTGEGRIYTITVTATDASGNKSSETVTVSVPHDHSITSRKPVSSNAELAIPGLQVTALQNPAAHHFMITTRSAAAGTLQVRVSDAGGRVVETKTVAANSSFELGAGYRAGVYFLQVSLNGKVKTLLLVKTAE